jgi:hypothetical protein
MSNDRSKAQDEVKCSVASGMGASSGAQGGGVFAIQCHDAEGNLKWQADTHNLVVNVGLQDMNAKYFTGSGYTAAWYLGVYGAASSNNPAAGDTMASHAGWTEVTAYSEATRPVCTFGTPTTADPSVATNSASPAVFTINGTTVIGGAFLTTSNTKGGTTGILFSAGDFAAPGDRSVIAGDTLTLTYTFSLDAA